VNPLRRFWKWLRRDAEVARLNVAYMRASTHAMQMAAASEYALGDAREVVVLRFRQFDEPAHGDMIYRLEADRLRWNGRHLEALPEKRLDGNLRVSREMFRSMRDADQYQPFRVHRLRELSREMGEKLFEELLPPVTAKGGAP
jgi:hypothetical protein